MTISIKPIFIFDSAPIYQIQYHTQCMAFQVAIFLMSQCVNTWRPRQHRRRFADDIIKCIFFNENCCVLIKTSLKYVRKGPIDNNPALVQITAWRRLGDKTFSEPMMVSLPTHMCVVRSRWVNGKGSAVSVEHTLYILRQSKGVCQVIFIFATHFANGICSITIAQLHINHSNKCVF